MKKSLKLLSVLVVLTVVLTACGAGDTSTEQTQAPVDNGGYSNTEVYVSDMVTDSQIPQESQNQLPVETASDTQATQTSTEAPTEAPTQAAVQPVSLTTTEEIVNYFNLCANKIKTDAVKVTKNYEKRTVGELVAPEALQSTADKLIKEYIKDDTTPIVYSTKDEIKTNYLVPGQDYVSCLTVDAAQQVTAVDNGTEYEIYILLKDEMNPSAGSGVGSVCDVIEAAEVASVGMVKEFTTNYYSCVVRAKIDKATGRMIWANYTTPVLLDVTVNLFGTHSGRIGLTFEKDYTIEY